MKINDAVRADIANSVLCWLASVDEDGVPNVTPKEMFDAYDDDRVVIADIASSRSVANIAAHPKVCVSFVDIFRQKGFKIVGSAEIIAAGEPRFADYGATILERTGTAYPVRNLIVIEVERIQRIWAPSYALFPERSESERMEEAYATYGVRPLG